MMQVPLHCWDRNRFCFPFKMLVAFQMTSTNTAHPYPNTHLVHQVRTQEQLGSAIALYKCLADTTLPEIVDMHSLLIGYLRPWELDTNNLTRSRWEFFKAGRAENQLQQPTRFKKHLHSRPFSESYTSFWKKNEQVLGHWGSCIHHCKHILTSFAT